MPVKFKPPRISRKKYLSIEALELDALSLRTANSNREWMRENLRDPNVYWALVTGLGEVIDTGGPDAVPSVFDVTNRFEGEESGVYLLRRPNYADVEFLFLEEFGDDITNKLDLESKHTSPYIKNSTGILALTAQSGVFNKLSQTYALGLLRTLCPPNEGRQARRVVGMSGSGFGSTVVMVRNKQYGRDGKSLYIASQPAERVHSRGIRTAEELQPDMWFRIERHHRYDDPILDIFDTYRIEAGLKGEKWPPLVVYRSKT